VSDQREPVPLLPRQPGEPERQPERLPDGAGLVVQLTLKALPGEAPADVRLRRLIKAALRAYGFKLLRCEDLPGQAQAPVPLSTAQEEPSPPAVSCSPRERG
jgi:hypothetical protein